MASNGSFGTGAYSNRYLSFNWWTTNRDVANNRTTIHWELKGAGGSTSDYIMAGNFKVIIDGQQVYYSGSRIRLWNGTLVASGDYTLYHDNSGNRNFGAYAEGGIYTTAVNVSGSGNWWLDSIPRDTLHTYVNMNGKSKTVQKFYVNVDGKSRLVRRLYANVNGKAKLVYERLSS